MPLPAPRTKTPAVEQSTTPDVTERQVSPPMRGSPVPAIPADAARSRRATLVSPIPALLAASMGEIREEHGDATPLPIDIRVDETSRFQVGDQVALLMESEIDYVVEVLGPAKKRP